MIREESHVCTRGCDWGKLVPSSHMRGELRYAFNISPSFSLRQPVTSREWWTVDENLWHLKEKSSF